jgi:ABC-type dipeptide/oligopeptide/nickel transport system permease component
MQRYILRRIFQTAFTLFLLSMVVFLLARVLGDPIAFMLPFDAASEDVARLRKQLGFDQPLYRQYWDFASGILRGDLGLSTRSRIPVVTLIAEHWPKSLVLVTSALGWATVASLFLGVWSAARRDGYVDTVARGIAVLGQSVPTFWLGIVLIQLFSVRLEWLPSAGYGTFAHLVLPSFTIGLLAVAGMTRLLRSSMLDVLDSEFVKKARIMGVPDRSVVWKHALRNALIPVIAFTGQYFGLLIAAGVVVETVFAWPGAGRLAYQAVLTRDYPLIQGVVLVMAMFVLVINLAVDILYAYVDPRIRYDRD